MSVVAVTLYQAPWPRTAVRPAAERLPGAEDGPRSDARASCAHRRCRLAGEIRAAVLAGLHVAGVAGGTREANNAD